MDPSDAKRLEVWRSSYMSQLDTPESDAALNGYQAASEGSISCPICFDKHQEILLMSGGKSLRRCSRCDVVFLLPQPLPESLEAHFESGGVPGFDNMESTFEQNRDRVLSRVASYIQTRRTGGHILDVGCATGYFLWRFFADPKWRKRAVELSHYSAKIAASRAIAVFPGTLVQAGFQDDQFDIVTVLDAFYYFSQPRADLAEIRRILRRDGRLLLELPLSRGRIWRTTDHLGQLLSRSRKPLIDSSDHLFYYDRKSISILLESCGFRLEEILPLPANRQPDVWRDVAYRLFSLLATMCDMLSASTIFISPRFLVVASRLF